MKEVLYEVRCLKSTEDMILAFAGQFKQLYHEPDISFVLFSDSSNKRKLSTEDMILALAGQFKQLSHEPEKFR